jgi:hypothetical protein
MIRALDIELGMKVWACDGLLIGRVGRVWRPDGSIVPPLPGNPDVVAGTWSMNDGAGLLQINRFVAPDWFVPFTDVASVVDHDVHLAFTETQGRKRGWQSRPTLIDMVRAGDVLPLFPISPGASRLAATNDPGSVITAINASAIQ